MTGTRRDIRVRFHRSGHLMDGEVGFIVASNGSGEFILEFYLGDWTLVRISDAKPLEVEPVFEH